MNIRNCRCWVDFDPQGVARHVKAEDVKVEGTKVTGGWYAEGPLVDKAEAGDYYPGDLPDPGTYFMRRAAARVIAARRAGR